MKPAGAEPGAAGGNMGAAGFATGAGGFFAAVPVRVPGFPDGAARVSAPAAAKPAFSSGCPRDLSAGHGSVSFL
jgi:hypothetical protein